MTIFEAKTSPAKPVKKASPALSRSGFPMSYINDLAKRRAKLNKLKDKMYAKIDARDAR